MDSGLIHIACAADESYAPHCAAMLQSALSQHAAGALDVHFLHGSAFSRRTKARLEKLVTNAGCTLAFHEIADAAVSGLPTLSRIPAVMWYRIFLPELLPDNKRVLYLDADTLVMQPLDALWRTDLGANYIGAVTNVFEPALRDWPSQLGLAGTSHYFNSGVMLLNLDRMRRDGCTEAIRAQGMRGGACLRFPDQDALNLVLAGHRHRLHPRWNCMSSLPYFADSATFFPDGAVAEALGNPAIVHFEGEGRGKPWHFLNQNPHRTTYHRHLRAAGWPPQWPEGLSLANVARRYLPEQVKLVVKSVLGRVGYGIARSKGRPVLFRRRNRQGPSALTTDLRADHPRLIALRERYRRLASPLAATSVWNGTYLKGELELPYFRGDNAYIWQHRDVGEGAERKYALYAEYVAARDPRRLLKRLGEDGAFGCFVFASRTGPVSRDLLDSVNEMYFLDRNIGLFDRTDLRVLDIGAGYGRLAHRMSAAVPGLSHYWCVDAIPESTFLSELYLKYRGSAPPAVVVPLDEIGASLANARIDVAVNIHSFSEMPHGAVKAWLTLIATIGVPHLLIVSNDEDRLLSYEEDRSRSDLLPTLTALDYRLRISEPVISDGPMRDRIGTRHHFMLFERVRG